MAQFVATNDNNFDITGYPYTLAKSDNVTLQINRCVDLDGNSDYVQINGLLAQCANDTAGSVCYWVFIDADDAADHYGFSISRNASATANLFGMRHYLGASAPADDFRAFLYINGTNQWQWDGAANQTDALIGAWAHFACVQNGTSPLFYLNGADVTAAGNFSTATNKTKWFKSIITDSANPSDVASIGAYRSNGVVSGYHDGKIDELLITSDVLSPAEVAAIYTSGRANHPANPDNTQAHYPFDGNANDDSGNGINGTLVGTAAVINDPAATGIYSTTSPEAYLIEEGFEYAIDAGAGKYILVSAASDTEITPAGTSLKYEYCFTDSATRAGASWSAGWQAIADLETSLVADSATDKKRYLHLKTQLNSDGTATPTLSDMTVTYTTPVVAIAGGGHKIMRGVGTGVMTGVC